MSNRFATSGSSPPSADDSINKSSGSGVAWRGDLDERGSSLAKFSQSHSLVALARLCRPLSEVGTPSALQEPDWLDSSNVTDLLPLFLSEFSLIISNNLFPLSSSFDSFIKSTRYLVGGTRGGGSSSK